MRNKSATVVQFLIKTLSPEKIFMPHKTHIIFQFLIKIFSPDLICDIGSMDGMDALRFRKDLPHGKIICFEANPNNIELIHRNPIFKKQKINIEEKVVWNKDGDIKFFIEELSQTTGEEWRRGISSTKKRKSGSLGTKEIITTSIRLDTFVKNLNFNPTSIALWIDVEGASFEVLEGISEIIQKVLFIHVETENKKVWLNQKLKPETVELMKKNGFILIAEEDRKAKSQDNLIFMNSQLYARNLIRIHLILLSSNLLSKLYKKLSKFVNLKKIYQRYR